jgi:hypothetical protein
VSVAQLSRDWRRWVGGVGFLLALAFLASRSCRSESEAASAEVRFVVGGAGADLRRLEAELYRPGDDELLGFYRQSFERGAAAQAARWPLRADAGMYRLVVSLVTARGPVRTERAVQIEERAIITVDLEPDLSR